jgi:hypothetical protein
MNQITQRPEPFDWSQYQRTYNNAIDIVGQAVGHARRTHKPLKAIILKPASHDLLRAGVKLLMAKLGQKMDEMAPMFFDGVEIKRGNSMQFDSIKCEYYQSTINEMP